MCWSGQVLSGHQGIAYEHYCDAADHTFRKAPFIGQPSADQWHKIYQRKEDRENLTGPCGIKSKFGLQIEKENRQHGVITEPLASVGKRQHIQAGRLVLNITDC